MEWKRNALMRLSATILKNSQKGFYNNLNAILAQASASARAWWWFVIGQPQASATLPTLLRCPLAVSKSMAAKSVMGDG